jgi:two-component system, OmpR family, sensor histidine kinase BaeS
MPAPIRTRLVLSTFLVLLIGMGLAAVLAWLAVGNLYLKTQHDNLLAQANLTAAALQGAALPLIDSSAYTQTSNVQPGIHTRLLSQQGAVVVSLPLAPGVAPVPVPSIENAGSVTPAELLQRPEIRQALKGESATAIRRIASAGNQRVLYAAAPILSTEGRVIGLVYLATPLPPGGLPANLILQLVGVLLVTLFLAGLAGTLLARRIALPVEAISRAAGAVASGDLNVQAIRNSSTSELDDLAQAFNGMTASLRQSEQAKNAFIADVTHELRTPLTVIQGTLETLEDGALDDIEGRGTLLASMQHETSQLIRLVNDLLVLARADAGALKLDLKEVDVGELARSRCGFLAPLAGIHGVELRVTNGQGNCVYADADRLARVLDNLLDNAIRFAPQGSTVLTSVQKDGNEIRCMVTDQGKGIPAEHLPFIFERFYRLDSSRNRQTGGAGLGLAIVRVLVQAQGGRVRADSTENMGTSITFWLPAAENCLPTA